MKRDSTDCFFHRFNSSLAKRTRRLQILAIDISLVKPNVHVYARHFPAGDATKDPQLNLGKRFASSIKKKLPRTKRAKTGESVKDLAVLMSTLTDASNSKTNSTAVIPTVEDHSEDVESSEVVVSSFTTAVGEQLCTEYQVHKLPSDSDDCLSDSLSTSIM